MALMSSLQVGLVQRSSWMEPHFPKSLQRAHNQQGLRFNGVAPVSWLCNQDVWCVHLWSSLRNVPRHVSGKSSIVASASNGSNGAVTLPSDELVRVCAVAFKNVLAGLNARPVLSSCAPPLALVLFAIYALAPCAKLIQQSVSKKKWDSSPVKQIVLAYVRPVLLWMGIVSVCRVVDPIVLSTAASQAIKDRAVNFVRSLSTVLAFAVCTTNLTQQVQKSMENSDSEKGQNVGIQFISNAVRTSVWVAAVCLFMELLGFSTQKWITAGGLGTVLVTLAGREIFTNFLSSIMIHATRPFIENQWIQTKIEGQEVSGTVERVGWWSPTVIRGDDREAVHIPNHKFTVSIVRNLSQKTHWRIKTHLAISHLDAGKVAYVVADMRKVLAKHSQVEHKRLHRRVFLDFIHPENQALHILVSCFVKTSRFEEYLRVKESILLDLLRVISHHNARLATPIRSIQRAQVDDSHQNSQQKYDRTYLISENSVVSDVKNPAEHHSPKSKPQEDHAKVPGERTDSLKLEGLDSMGLNSKDITLLGAAFGKPLVKVADDTPAASGGDREETVPDEDDGKDAPPVKRGKIYVQDDVKEQIVDSIRGTTGEKTKRPPLGQENMVLGVALDGSKRTLTLESPERTEVPQQHQQQPAADARERER